MGKSLLIVESPAKSKTIQKYLGHDFEVLASYGHLRDLPHKGKPVDPDNDFQMIYEITADHQRYVAAIVSAAKRSDTIYLATDMDREGEAISWHILEILKERHLVKGKTIHRVTFSEITKSAVTKAVANPRDLDLNLINAQQARRALDYLVGYNLSPVLWKKVKAGLSAGRVQSPALRMMVEREDEIQAFVPKDYWTLEGVFAKGIEFATKLTKYNGSKVEQFSFDVEEAALVAKATLERALNGKSRVKSVTRSQRTRKPYAPFTTSTLQQDAANRLGFNSQRTMRTAQTLYEGLNVGTGESIGLITYMRTDAVNLSDDAIAEIRGYIASRDPSLLPDSKVVYYNKSKNAQEAHEAIRPSSVLRTPQSIKQYLDSDQFRLYELIWKRAVACQMKPAIMNTLSIEFAAPTPGGESTFKATGSAVAFAGFLSVYAPAKRDDDEDTRLPDLAEGDVVDVKGIVLTAHATEPPPRYNEASTVKQLEALGIGRPSTYASILETLKKRNYVEMDGQKFVPTEIGMAVGHFLSQHFEAYVDYQFTANLEDELDAVARGEKQWKPLLSEFWVPFIGRVKDRAENASRQEAKGRRLLGNDPVSGKPIFAFVGKYGGTLALGDLDAEKSKDPEKKVRFTSLPEGAHVNSITLEEALPEFRYPLDLGQGVNVRKGRNGLYLNQGETNASIPEGIDGVTITLTQALAAINERKEQVANRDVKDFGNGVKILNGKFGVYVTDGKINATIPKGIDPKAVTLEEAKDYLEKKAKAPAGGFRKGGFKKGKGKGKGGKSSGGKGKARPDADDLPM